LWEIRHWIEAGVEGTTFASETVGNSIKCGGTWRLLSHGTWTGTLCVETSEDGGATWTKSRTFTSRSDRNFDTSGTETYAQQFLVRTKMTGYGSGTCNCEISADPFEWVGVARVVAVPYDSSGSSTTYATAAVLIEETLGATTATPVWSEGAWSEKNGYPACSAFFNDRLCFAGNTQEPNSVWISKTGNYYDYGRSFPLADDDGITINAPSRELNQVYNMVDVNRLAEFTSAGVFSTEAGPDGTLSPTSVIVRANDLAGASKITPAVINDRAVYFQTFGRILRDTAYSFETEGFTGINLTQYSSHLFKEYAAVEMVYQREPWQTLWIVREDGKMVSLTYTKQAELYGWAVHSTAEMSQSASWRDAGRFLSVCCVPGTDIDDLYVAVERRFNIESATNTVTIEKLSNRNATADPQRQVFLDCSFTVDSPKDITQIDLLPSTDIKITCTSHGFISGEVELSDIFSMMDGDTFSMLNGKRYTLADVTTHTFKLTGTSTLFPEITYTSVITGKARKVFQKISFPAALASAVNGQSLFGMINAYSSEWTDTSAGLQMFDNSDIVDGVFGTTLKGTCVVCGMPYISECETTNIDFDTTSGSTQKKLKEISNAAVGLYETYGGKIGTSRTDMHPLTNNNGSALKQTLTNTAEPFYQWQPIGPSPALFTGMFNQSIISGSGNPISIIIRQEDPYPITITNINADVAIGE
jgi:hypothetical protein